MLVESQVMFIRWRPKRGIESTFS